VGIGAKDQTNRLVAGSSRNVSQDSGAQKGTRGREDAGAANKLRTRGLADDLRQVDLERASGRCVVSMHRKEE